MINFEESSFLDMFAGSGLIGLEALSRGFSQIVSIEKNPKAFQIINSNFKRFAPPPKLIKGDSLKVIPALKENFDVIYIDPPYFSGIYEKSLEAVKNISKGIVILEHVTNVDFADFEIIKQKKYGNKLITFLK